MEARPRKLNAPASSPFTSVCVYSPRSKIAAGKNALKRSGSGRISPATFAMASSLFLDDIVSFTFYDRIFSQINSQKTIVESIEIDVNEGTDADKTACKEILEIKNDILSSTYRTLFKNARITSDKLRLLLQNKLSKTTERLILKLLKPTTHILGILDIIGNRVAKFYEEQSDIVQTKKTRVTQTSNAAKVKEPLVICRICENAVFKSQFEEHIKKCYIAYKSTEPATAIDEQLKQLSKELKKDLEIKWPTTKNNILNIMIPLHMILLIDKLLAQYDDYEKFYQTCSSVLNTFARMVPFTKTGSTFINKAISITKKKVCTTYAIYQLKKNAQTSTADPGAPLSPSNSFVGQLDLGISGFTFIKHVNDGHFARVFLCKKNITGDIFAIKVVPKIFLEEKKNIKKHILHEKDFLFQISSDFVAKICMYILFNSFRVTSFTFI